MRALVNVWLGYEWGVLSVAFTPNVLYLLSPQDVPTLLDVDESFTPRAEESGQPGAQFFQHARDEQGQQQGGQRSGSAEPAGRSMHVRARSVPDLFTDPAATRSSAGLGRKSTSETPPQ